MSEKQKKEEDGELERVRENCVRITSGGRKCRKCRKKSSVESEEHVTSAIVENGAHWRISCQLLAIAIAIASIDHHY